MTFEEWYEQYRTTDPLTHREVARAAYQAGQEDGRERAAAFVYGDLCPERDNSGPDLAICSGVC